MEDVRVGPQVRLEMKRTSWGWNIIILLVVLVAGILVGRSSPAVHARVELAKTMQDITYRLPSSSEATSSAHSGILSQISVDSSLSPVSQAVSSMVSAKLKRRWLATPLWEPNAQDSPWYFHGEQGNSARARQQLEMRKNSGYQPRDSPPSRDGTARKPVLSGIAWHHGPGNCPARCALHGVCSPSGVCDCAPFFWGGDCSIPVVTQRICVYNDSQPWFCDKPACIHSHTERVTVLGVTSACIGTPLAECPLHCSGRGRCVGQRCACFEGFKGAGCEIPVEYGVDDGISKSGCMGNCSGRGECEKGFCRCTPPFWGIDCAMGPSGGPRCRKRPCLYVYELPARMNVLGLKVEPDWRRQLKGRKFDYRTPPIVHEALLSSPHRTSLSSEADLYYVPTWDWHGSWGNPEVYYRAHRYISTNFPFWNASGGADHIFTIARDAGACATPWGSLQEELQSAILLTNWGGVTGLSGAVEERCFRPGWDIVLPGTLKQEIVEMSPWLLPPFEEAQQHTRRSTQLFFFGALCWKTDHVVRDLGSLRAKCKRSFSQSGFLSRYSFGLRYDIFERFSSIKGFRLFATDFAPSLPAGGVNVNSEILRSKFCLCPSGTGWGMRVFHVLVLGCIPVLTQHDGVHPPVAQAFDPEVLNWERFSVVVRYDQIQRLPELLDAVDLNAKREALRKVWTRTVWADALSTSLRKRLPGADAFETLMLALAVRISGNKTDVLI